MHINKKNQKLTKRIVVSVVLLVVAGVLLHDTKFDKALTIKTFSIATIAAGLSAHILNVSDGFHTHVEISTGHNPFTQMPRTQMKNGHRRFAVPKHSKRTNANFGTSAILWPSV